ncbi:nitronate monooxygenase, partial [Pseudomonas aeruginosa]|uniref:nitronate monooxygenase n=1 Tax=Pseudomonas aeruginosa TaxID=287 RepID=UPI003CC571DA
MTDRFTRLLGIQQPINQAPMLGVSTPALAAAVTNAGGLGSIAITCSAAEKGRGLFREAGAVARGGVRRRGGGG